MLFPSFQNVITIEKFEIIIFAIWRALLTTNFFEKKNGARMTKMMIFGKG